MPRRPHAGEITTIAPQAKKRKHLGERVNIFINGQYSFSLDAALIEKHELRRGMNISAEFLSQLLREDGDAKAYARALHLLSYRPRSTNEVRERLARDGWPEEVNERVLARLQNEGYLSDAYFAGLWVENRTLSRPRGARVLRQELRQKGVARETIDAALPDTNEEQQNAVAAARAILSSKARIWRSLDEREKRDKLFQAMQRRGFSFSDSRAAWQQLQDESGNQ